MSDTNDPGAEVCASGWFDDAPITDEQIKAVRRDLDTPLAQRGAAFAPFVVRKLLAEVERLRAVEADLEQLRAERARRQLDDRDIDRVLAMVMMREGGSATFSAKEMIQAPEHGEFVCCTSPTTGAMTLAFQARESVPRQPESAQGEQR